MLKTFFLTLIVVSLSIGAIIVVINMVGKIRYFVDNQVPMSMIIQYYIFFSGWVIKAFLPVFIMLTTLFTMSFLARKNEILAMKASGLSLYRIAAPILIVVFLLSVGHFYYNEYIYPPGNKRRVEIKEFDIKKHSKRRYEQLTNFYRQISPGYFYTIALFNVPKSEGQDIKIYQTENSSLRNLTTANALVYKNNHWLFKNGIVRTFSDTTRESYVVFDSLSMPDIKEKPSDLAKKVGKPEDMGLDELENYINLMKRVGGPYYREAIDLQIKYAFPLSSFIVVLLSIPFASNPRRGGIAVSFAVGALIALLYFVLFRVLQSAGYNEKLPDFIAVWGVNCLFMLIGIVALIKARK
jgi:LPS export ABC transporter permease LptG